MERDRFIHNALNIQEMMNIVDEDFDRPPMYDVLRVIDNMIRVNLNEIIENTQEKYSYVSNIELYKNQEIQECSICLDEIQIGEFVYKLPCKHVFHDICIEPWVKTKTTCPKCRYCLEKHSSSVQIKK